VEDFEPRIVCFSCKFSWGYLDPLKESQKGVDHWVPVACSGKIDAAHILEAFAKAADGVLILVCPEGDCHLQDGNFKTEAKVFLLQRILPSWGLDSRRLRVIAAMNPDGEKISALVRDMAAQIAHLGPARLFADIPAASQKAGPDSFMAGI
jgi:coenzyme F420-reducing hydrogenase delta subunit